MLQDTNLLKGLKENEEAVVFTANKELIFQNEEKEEHASELILTNKELVFQNEKKERWVAKLVVACKLNSV